MQNNVFVFMFLAAAPLALMPTIVALVTRHRHRYLLGCSNLVVWGLAFLSVREFMVPDAASFLVPVPVFAAAWIGLAAWAFKGAHGRKGQTTP